MALRPVPAPVQMDFAPYFSVVSFTISTHSSYASSMVMRSHLSLPRSSRARFSGWMMRSGWYTASTMARQRMHKRPSVTGEFGSPSTLTSLPSLSV